VDERLAFLIVALSAGRSVEDVCVLVKGHSLHICARSSMDRGARSAIDPASQPGGLPSWMDHHQLIFWFWAFLQDAEQYLKTSQRERALLMLPRQSPPYFAAKRQEFDLIRRKMELDKYHFVTTMGTLLRVLKRAQHLFPGIQPAYSQAQHLLKEGKGLRDIIEHADEYLECKGQKQDAFVREATGIATSIPGSSPGIADATSTVVDENGHWLGGRLNVERVVAEVRAIAEEAQKIPAPSAARLRPRPT
jgi:hypothetical protein